MAVDASVYNQLGANVVPPINPLLAQAQLYQTAGNALAVQNQLAKRAAGEAFQQSIKPDGTTDQAALLRNLAADPRAAMAAQESAQQGQTLSGDEYKQHMGRLSYAANAAAQLLTMPGGPTQDAIKAAYDDAVRTGVMKPEEEAAVLNGFGADPGQNAVILRQRLFQNIGAQQALTSSLPNPTPTNTGGTTFFRDANPLTNPNGMGAPGTGFVNTPGPQFIGTGGANVPTTGGLPIGPGIPNTLTPGELAAPVQIGTTPTGAPIGGANVQRLGILGIGADGKPIPSALGTGRLPPALLNPNKPQAATAAAPAGSTPPTTPLGTVAVNGQTGIQQGLGSAETAALTTQGSNSANKFSDIADQGNQAQWQNATLGNMLTDAQQFTTGMTKANDFKTFLTRQTPTIARGFGISPDKVAANESFDKLASQIASQQGAGSDARLAVAQSANPSSHLSPQSVDMILRQLQGNADFIQARANLAATYPNQADRAGFDAQIRDTLDPRAFQVARMTPAQRTTYYATLAPADRTTVLNALHTAMDKGLIQRAAPTAPTPAPASPAITPQVPVN